jgi:hypothetical protein
MIPGFPSGIDWPNPISLPHVRIPAASQGYVWQNQLNTLLSSGTVTLPFSLNDWVNPRAASLGGAVASQPVGQPLPLTSLVVSTVYPVFIQLR